MKFSEHWLRQHVRTDATRDELAATLTAIGLEVEEVTPLGEALDGVVVARIVSAEKHPEADRLQVCQVDAGGDTPLQIVCGAPNARPGLVAPLATIGTRVGELTIKAAKLRGVASNGMLCSAKELGLDADASGLLELPADAPVGTPLAQYLGLPDASIEIKLTPNRADCFSVRGIAFDVAAAFGSEVTPLEAHAIPAQGSARMEVSLEAGERVPRFAGRVIEDVDASVATPVWMAERLRRAGVRPISFLVDVTQYVMLELGQPMHAFDRDALEGSVVVRPARAGETVKLLDGRTVELDGEFLVVADSRGGRGARAVALGGIMGGEDTKVGTTTRNVFLEAAHWIPSTIIGRSRRLGLHTDAGHRFERGVDPSLPPVAVEYATRLILDIAGGTPGPLVDDTIDGALASPATIALRRARIARVLGIAIADADVERILRALGMQVEASPEGWQVTSPRRRFDIAIEEDLIEELARIHGYSNVPARSPSGEIVPHAPSETRVTTNALRDQLAARDYAEAITFAFVGTEALRTWGLEDGAVPLANPLSADLAVMRTSLLPGLVAALGENLKRQQTRVRLFEAGRRYAKGEDAPIENARLAGVATGALVETQWGESSREVDFFDIKGDVESLLALAGASADDVVFAAGGPAWLHRGRAATITRGDAVVGHVGMLDPRLQKALDLDADVYVFDLDLDLLAARAVPRAAALSRYPSVRRDLSFTLPEAVAYAEVEAALRAAVGPVLVDLFLFDRYVGPNLGEGFKSLSTGLILQDRSRTLTDHDADHCVALAVSALETGCKAKLRG